MWELKFDWTAGLSGLLLRIASALEKERSLLSDGERLARLVEYADFGFK